MHVGDLSLECAGYPSPVVDGVVSVEIGCELGYRVVRQHYSFFLARMRLYLEP